MKEFLVSLDWQWILSGFWTLILLPVCKQIYEYAKQKKIDKYVIILKNNMVDAVKEVYEIAVKDIKGTSDWTLEKQNEVKEMAKQKAVHALSATAYECLKLALKDFDGYLDSLVGTVLYDLKNQPQ